jgi:hypothetical protein
LPLGNSLLPGQGAGDGVDHAGELDQEPDPMSSPTP